MFGGTFVGGTLVGRTGKVVVLGLLAALAAGVVLLLSARPVLASETYVVNRTTNESDASLGDDICDTSTGDTEIDAFLDSVPNTEYVIRFYSNPRDTGEGKTFVGDILVNTNLNGTSPINDFAANRTVPVGQSITATATKVAAPRNTSEFSGEPRSVRAAP